ncbi:MAG: nitroreductase [Promethearchaeota archaeon]|nr:MAG: nitroreductase [Candidatus Lokiarchaeota archaeon]
MEFTQPITDLIRSRTSWRTYKSQPLGSREEEKIIKFIEHLGNKTPFVEFEPNARFQIFHILETDPKEKKMYGTYGFIQGANSFLVGSAKRTEFAWEHYGYLFEKIILYATDMGLGTCWLGGTFNRSVFAEKISLGNDEFLPAISPIGYPEERRIKERVIRAAIRAKKRKTWEELFFITDFSTSLSEQDAGEYALPLEMVRLGPSASNRQPWRIIKDQNTNTFHFYVVQSNDSTGKGYNKMRRLDIGIAVCHFDLTVKDLQLMGSWQWIEECPKNIANYQYTISWVHKS